MWQSITGIVTEIRKCEAAEATMAGITMAFVCIDTLAFLSMPAGRSEQNRNDFIAWVDTYLRGHPEQPYQYAGIDVYGARCSVLHTFSAEAEIHRRDQNIKKFAYHDGGRHAYDPNVSEELVIIGTASFLNDVISGVEQFIRECHGDSGLQARVEARLTSLHTKMPFPAHTPAGTV